MLPISNYKEVIVNSVRNHDFTIVCAETGSGKSTQIPQYLSEYYDQVIVTEPRIMAAKTLARRVSEEMNTTLGMEVGYRTGYDKCFSFNSKILYCTDGLQLIRTIFDEDYQKNNVLVIDEVHEWNLNIETLIAWCKFMTGKWKTKVVIMSATLDTESLANYFGKDVSVINVPGNLYDVEMEERSEGQFITSILEKITQHKNVLAFMPGKKEISDTIKELSETGSDAVFLPLHGEMDWDEQKKCFEEYSKPKVVVATNVAQTSLTIPDIDAVIDNGQARVSRAENGIQGLYLEDISRSDIMQRRGRAGRTKNGEYILCSSTSLKNRKEFSTPEIKRSILDRVVLQLAAIGLDAEELAFYHQPQVSAIHEAKKQLIAIGALMDNKITELGRKIVKIPVSVQFARMIVEAEKYGVTEQVMTIAAIIEMGGLLGKDASYSQFTREDESDLLAELDVWNVINNMGYIEFDKLGIKKKAFFKIKEHIKKLKEVLYGIVEMTNNDDPKAVLRSCLSGLVSHIYVRDYYETYLSEDGRIVRLDKNTCIDHADFVIGIPKTIEYKDRYGFLNSMNLISFVSQISLDTLVELAPNSIKREESLRYSKSEDAVEVTTKSYFAGEVIDTEVCYIRNHPSYQELKEEFEAEMKRYNMSTYESFQTPQMYQEYVVIDGKQFKVERDTWNKKYRIFLDSETLFTTDTKEVFLDTGERVQICSDTWFKEDSSIPALRIAVERKRLKRLRDRKKQEYEGLKAGTLEEALENRDKIGKIELAMNNGGYGDEPIYMYGCISLKKNTVSFKLIDDEELANSDTREALQYLFMKETEKKYSENRFSHQEGKKKKVLTDSEKEVKKDFDSLVRELLFNLTFENATENLEFLEEYYQELMG